MQFGWILGGPGGIRTRDLISAIDARSQLRYRPVHYWNCILNKPYPNSMHFTLQVIIRQQHQ